MWNCFVQSHAQILGLGISPLCPLIPEKDSASCNLLGHFFPAACFTLRLRPGLGLFPVVFHRNKDPFTRILLFAVDTHIFIITKKQSLYLRHRSPAMSFRVLCVYHTWTSEVSFRLQINRNRLQILICSQCTWEAKQFIICLCTFLLLIAVQFVFSSAGVI